MMAEKAGYGDAHGIAAPGDPVMEVHYIVREGVAILAAKLTGKL